MNFNTSCKNTQSVIGTCTVYKLVGEGPGATKEVLPITAHTVMSQEGATAQFSQSDADGNPLPASQARFIATPDTAGDTIFEIKTEYDNHGTPGSGTSTVIVTVTAAGISAIGWVFDPPVDNAPPV